ncbi:uncharacterized protein LOC126213194 isoform X5 [Schistocerca nitens]|uniref:uncharacterized protein LOC126213194 isoform X5 n=1 Tax=Schistocerca nitens TaxID=7011 RepID=UPI0021174FF4|nr:uncharacterized protein LOC126213194 isoform X5 [Schistocerca nitens]
MDQEPATWIKKEEMDEVKTEIPFMAQVYPLSMNVKEELEEGANKESIEDPLGISWSTDFIKEDPELNLELSVAENIVETSTRYASDSARSVKLVDNSLPNYSTMHIFQSSVSFTVCSVCHISLTIQTSHNRLLIPHEFCPQLVVYWLALLLLEYGILGLIPGCVVMTGCFHCPHHLIIIIRDSGYIGLCKKRLQ